MDLRRLFRSPTVGSIADWTSLGQLLLPLCGGGALLSWAASSIDGVMQHGWGAALFAGLAALCVLISFLSLAAIAWRIFRPLPHAEPIPERQTGDAAGQIDGAAIIEFKNKTTETLSAIITSLTDKDLKFGAMKSEILALGRNISAIDELLKPSPEVGLLAQLGMPEAPPARSRFESVMRHIARSEAIQVENYKEIDGAVKDIKKSIDSIITWQNDFSDYAIGMFRADRTLEAYENNTSKLDSMARRLGDPNKNPEIFNQWGLWTNEFNEFKNLLRSLCGLVRPYTDVLNDIFETPNYKFKSSHWTYDFNLMSDDQKHDFKTFKIISCNYETAKEQIVASLNSVRYSRI